MVDALGVVGLNVTLQVGGVAQEVTVVAEPPALRTADGRLGQTIRNDVYTALPLVMNTGGPRDPTAFMFLMPGVQSVGPLGQRDGRTGFHQRHLRRRRADHQRGGAGRGPQPVVRHLGGSRRSVPGGDERHGGDVQRPGRLELRRQVGDEPLSRQRVRVLPQQGARREVVLRRAKPDDNQHEYGFTLGGPIRRNRMFFFVAYDGYRDRRQTESRLVSIPTAAQRNGDFSALPVLIYDPRRRGRTRTAPASSAIRFPATSFRPNRISPISRNLQSFLPDPTNAGLQNNYLGGSLPIGFNNDNLTSKVDLNLSARHQVSVLFAHGTRRQHTPFRGGANAQTALPLPYTETRLVEEIPTTAQVEAHLRDELALGESGQPRVRAPLVPIANATIDGRYPAEAGLRGLPAGEADSAFPESPSPVPNAPTQWRGTDARAFTEYLNNFTLQDNLQWTRGKHAMTFGFQAQRMEADERERTYGSLATFGFSNVQTAGFGATGTLHATTGNAYASFLLGDLNATTVIEDSRGGDERPLRHLRLLGAGRLQGDAESLAEPRSALRHHEAVHRGLRSLVVHESRSAEPCRRRISGRPAVRGLRPQQLQCRTPIETYYGNVGPRLGAGVQPERPHGAARRLRDHVLAARRRRRTRRRAQRHRHARASPPTPRSRAPTASRPPTTGTTACRRIRRRRSSIPSLNAGFVTGRGTGGGVTYGDPEIGGRPPRYQNWNAGCSTRSRAR